MSGAQAALQASARALLLLPLDQGRQPAGRSSFLPLRQQAMQIERLGAPVHSFEVTHRLVP
jgi:hypothetical protein